MLPLVRRMKPDIVLVDIALSDMEGLESVRRIKAELPRTRVLLLSVVDEISLRVAATKYGADGFVKKGAPISQIFSLIRGKTSQNGAPPGS